jgi:hypothetical protein
VERLALAEQELHPLTSSGMPAATRAGMPVEARQATRKEHGMTDTIRATAGPIHGHFGLTYANYLVIPRSLLQSMPEQWQQQFVDLVDELHTAFAHVPQSDAYDVIAGFEREVGELDDDELAKLGITRTEDEDDLATRYVDRNGTEMHSGYRIVWPAADPVPHYNRGRTYIQPAI